MNLEVSVKFTPERSSFLPSPPPAGVRSTALASFPIEHSEKAALIWRIGITTVEERALRERITDFDASDRLSRDDVHRRGA